MFRTRWLSSTTTSDEGFSITLKSRTKLLYEVDGKSMVITTEGAGRYIDVFHSSMAHWLDDPSAIDDEVDRRNVDNITRALESRGLNVRIVT
jgi:uncharacterized protein YcgI (DUF1989 family)